MMSVRHNARNYKGRKKLNKRYRNTLKIIESQQERLERILNKEPDEDFGVLSDECYENMAKECRELISQLIELREKDKKIIDRMGESDVIEFVEELHKVVEEAAKEGFYYSGNLITKNYERLKADDYFAHLFK